MEKKSLAEILKQCAFFEKLPSEYLELLAGCAKNVRFEPDQFIFREGREANHFYLIRQGRVALEMGAPGRGSITVQTLEEGDIVGWSWLFPPYRWHFDARAAEPTHALALDGKCLRKKCEEDPRLGYEMMKRFAKIMVERLQTARMHLMDVYGPSRKT